VWDSVKTSIPILALMALGGCAAAEFAGTQISPPGARALPKVATVAAAPGDVAALDRAVTLITELKYSEAAAILAGLRPRLDAANDRVRAGEATFWQGYCHEKRGTAPAAIELYRLTVRDYAETPAAKRAQERLADLEWPEGGGP